MDMPREEIVTKGGVGLGGVFITQFNNVYYLFVKDNIAEDCSGIYTKSFTKNPPWSVNMDQDDPARTITLGKERVIKQSGGKYVDVCEGWNPMSVAEAANVTILGMKDRSSTSGGFKIIYNNDTRVAQLAKIREDAEHSMGGPH